MFFFERKLEQFAKFLELQYAVLSFIMPDEDLFKSKLVTLDKPTLLPQICPSLSTNAAKWFWRKSTNGSYLTLDGQLYTHKSQTYQSKSDPFLLIPTPIPFSSSFNPSRISSLLLNHIFSGGKNMTLRNRCSL